ncbi:DNA polymerase IV [Rubricoccus marinus]|uniref:DNA polymerase IV n=1 Tax=Rubricoccus marinus TaxID=716817 RepID=UPI001C528203|nr:DNA polymerase IV [Rubricoccus marinus]
MRKILHVDMDAFYASVEQRDDPALRGRPVAVGGRSGRGVVCAASYEARPFGVRSAMPMAHARKLCPDLIVVPPRFAVYKEVSDVVRGIFRSYTDLVEPLSLDEAYLDVTEPKRGPRSATLIAQSIRREIHEATGLTASAGVSFAKFFAKVASDLDKPDGLSVIQPHEARAFMAALPVEKFHGVGPATARRLHGLGIRTGADLQSWDEAALRQRLGKTGGWLYRLGQCDDTRPVRPHRVRKSVGVERTFSHNERGEAAILARLEPITSELVRRLDTHGLAGRTVTLKLKTARFVQSTRSASFASPVWQEGPLATIAAALLARPEVPDSPLRLVGLTVSSLVPLADVDGVQLSLEL